MEKKKKFSIPEAEIVNFKEEDVIRTSLAQGSDKDGFDRDGMEDW